VRPVLFIPQPSLADPFWGGPVAVFIRALLENVGADIDPMLLIRRIRNGMEIPGLKDALIKILQDFSLQVHRVWPAARRGARLTERLPHFRRADLAPRGLPEDPRLRLQRTPGPIASRGDARSLWPRLDDGPGAD
jgi:hypothetical protein